jgi:hypothetical protein
MRPLHIWIDDERLPLPDCNVWFRRNFDGFIAFVKSNRKRIVSISFDNSLGCGVEGHQLMTALEWEVAANGLRLPKLERLTAHTADANKWLPMKQTGDNIIRYNGSNCECWCDHYEHRLNDMRDADFSAYMKWRETPFAHLVF